MATFEGVMMHKIQIVCGMMKYVHKWSACGG
jgi:hypothetical protein